MIDAESANASLLARDAEGASCRNAGLVAKLSGYRDAAVFALWTTERTAMVCSFYFRNLVEKSAMANWNTPSDRKYMKTDEWIKFEGDTATIGISDYAQDQMNDITYVELPSVGESFGKGERFATFESVKAESDVFMPVSGTVSAINEALSSNSELLNADPYEKGWLIKVTVTGDADNADLMTADQYAEYCNTR